MEKTKKGRSKTVKALIMFLPLLFALLVLSLTLLA